MFHKLFFNHSRPSITPCSCESVCCLSVPVWALWGFCTYLYCYYRQMRDTVAQRNSKLWSTVDSRRPDLASRRGVNYIDSLFMLWLVILSCHSFQPLPQCFWSSDWLPCLSFWHLCCQLKHVHASPSLPALPETRVVTAHAKNSSRKEKIYITDLNKRLHFIWRCPCYGVIIYLNTE